MSKFNKNRVIYLEHIEKQRTSSLSIKRYCETHGLIAHLFSYYRNYELKPERGTKPRVFSEVKITPNSANLAKPDQQQNIDPIWLAEFLNGLFGVK